MHCDIEIWLNEIGMGQYSNAFIENDIDMSILDELTEDDLHKLGVSLGHGKKLLKAIAAINSVSVETPVKSPPDQHAAPERRQITVMFCDLVGSTALSVENDLEEYREILSDYQSKSTRIINSFDGFIARYMGDGLLVYFGYPQAHEDDPERAIKAALRILDEINNVAITSSAQVQVRIGIATGQVVAGDIVGEGASEELAVLGETPNLAARLHALASPGQVLISEGTYRLIGRLFSCTDAQEHVIKGFNEPVHIRQILGPGTNVSRFEAIRNPDNVILMGRESETMLLQQRWRRATDSEGQVVLLGGEPGIGKSRLVYELQHHIGDTQHSDIQLQCSAHHTNTAYYPFIQYVNQSANLLSCPDADKHDLLRLWLESLGITDEQALPLFSLMLSLPAEYKNELRDVSTQRQKEKTFELLCQCILAQSSTVPLLVVIEDVHWADPTSLDILDRLINLISNSAALVLITHRPEFSPQWLGAGHVTSHSLTRLGKREITQIIQSMTAENQLHEKLVQEIIDRTDGIPLFVEELTKTVIEDTMVGDAALTTSPISSTLPLSIPGTLQDSLVARLDRLADVKQIAQIASVIGRDFSYSLLLELAQLSNSKLDSSLQVLQSSGLVYKKSTSADTIFSFKHALVQDAAYQTLLKRNRKLLHEKLAEVMENRHQSIVKQHPELLAHHFTVAGKAEKAINYWQQAAELAIQRSAYHEALTQLDTAIELLGTAPISKRNRVQELELLIARAGILLPTLGYRSAETETAFTRANELAEKLCDHRNRFAALRGLHGIYLVRGNIEAATKVAQSCLEIAQSNNESQTLSLSHRLIGQSLYMQGELDSAQTHLTKAMDLAMDPKSDQVTALVHGGGYRLMTPAFLGQVLWLKGFPDKALSVSSTALEEAQKKFGAFTISANTYFLCWVYGWRREYSQVTKLSQRILSLAGEHDLTEWASPGSLLTDWEFLATAPADKAAERARKRLEAVRNQPGIMASYRLGLLAEALNGDCETQSMEVINEALALADDSGERWCEAELLRIRAKLHYLCNKMDECENGLSKALKLAKQQSALSFELRIATDLAKLWQQQQKLPQARHLLTETMNQFTEGFDTIDYKQSKTLLDSLS